MSQAQQALTIGVSATGLPKLFNSLVISGSGLASTIEQETPGDQSNISVADFKNPTDPVCTVQNFQLSLTGPNASFSGLSCAMTGVSQPNAGSATFNLSYTANLTVNYPNWIEQGKNYCLGKHGSTDNPFGPNNCGSFSFTASNLLLSVPVVISQQNQTWQFQAGTSASCDTSQASYSYENNIPSSSEMSGGGGCGYDPISGPMQQALEGISYNSAVEDAATTIINSIVESGNLGNTIVFDWTPNTFSFPGSSMSLQAGLTGLVSYNGTPFPPGQLTPPQLGLPGIPSNNDVQIYAADYLFTSLYWANFSAQQLGTTVTAGDLTEPYLLNTNNYQQSVQALYRAYPDCEMQVNIGYLESPTITFVTGYFLPPPYELSSQALLNIQSQLDSSDYTILLDKVVNQPYNDENSFQNFLQSVTGFNYATYGSLVTTAATTVTNNLASVLPSTDYTNLLTLTNQPFTDQGIFITALQNALGNDEATYQQQILNVAGVGIALLDHSPTCEYQVLSQGNWTTVFTIQITEQDNLDNFALSTSNGKQTLQSTVLPATAPLTATLVSSTISGVNTSDFQLLWAVGLQPAYLSMMQEIAAQGVPLPFIQGFTFQDSQITLQPGYAAVLANIATG